MRYCTHARVVRTHVRASNAACLTQVRAVDTHGRSDVVGYGIQCVPPPCHCLGHCCAGVCKWLSAACAAPGLYRASRVRTLSPALCGGLVHLHCLKGLVSSSLVALLSSRLTAALASPRLLLCDAATRAAFVRAQSRMSAPQDPELIFGMLSSEHVEAADEESAEKPSEQLKLERAVGDMRLSTSSSGMAYLILHVCLRSMAPPAA